MSMLFKLGRSLNARVWRRCPAQFSYTLCIGVRPLSVDGMMTYLWWQETRDAMNLLFSYWDVSLQQIRQAQCWVCHLMCEIDLPTNKQEVNVTTESSPCWLLHTCLVQTWPHMECPLQDQKRQMLSLQSRIWGRLHRTSGCLLVWAQIAAQGPWLDQLEFPHLLHNHNILLSLAPAVKIKSVSWKLISIWKWW